MPALKRMLLVVTDHRPEYLRRTIESSNRRLIGEFDVRVMVDDSGDREFGNKLDEQYPSFEIHHNEDNLGFGVTMARAWDLVRQHGVDFVFNLQNDFLFNDRIYLDDMQEVLVEHPYLAQIALNRQPINEKELAAGGVVEMWPEAYTEKEWKGLYWLEHNMRFTMNPALVPARIARELWPNPPRCEEQFGRYLMGRGWKSAIWGRKGGAPLVHHIGEMRAKADIR